MVGFQQDRGSRAASRIRPRLTSESPLAPGAPHTPLCDKDGTFVCGYLDCTENEPAWSRRTHTVTRRLVAGGAPLPRRRRDGVGTRSTTSCT